MLLLNPIFLLIVMTEKVSETDKKNKRFVGVVCSLKFYLRSDQDD
ncbi:hypothetical protein ACFP7A_07690 [Sporolactobacillus kofuensis]|uniref:Uncharacterized protein n=1 Tax=Sporolactobacillus kofuensis TaxID=269672 RepID=A0ABW1WHC4_9BACL|nr:hypothetical protein [Sporolactobacillus kofuensis]